MLIFALRNFSFPETPEDMLLIGKLPNPRAAVADLLEPEKWDGGWGGGGDDNSILEGKQGQTTTHTSG